MPRLNMTSDVAIGGSGSDDTPLNLGTRFTTSQAGSKLSGYKFRSPQAQTGTFTLWDTTTHTQVAGSTVTAPVVLGNNRIEIPTPVSLVVGREYIAAVFLGGTSHFLQGSGYFGGGSKTNGPLTFLGSKFFYNATIGEPVTTSTTYYGIEPEVLTASGVTLTGSASTWNFDLYTSAAAFKGDGWSFTSPGAVNSESGNATYTGPGVTIPFTVNRLVENGTSVPDTIYRDLCPGWTSIQMKALFTPSGTGSTQQLGIGLMAADNSWFEYQIIQSGQTGEASRGPNDINYGRFAFDSRGYDLRGLSQPIWLRIDRHDEFLAMMFSLNGIDWLVPHYNEATGLLAEKVPLGLDPVKMFISGGGASTGTYTIEEVTIQGAPVPPPEASGSFLGTESFSLRVGAQMAAAAYLGDEWVYQPTASGEYVAFTVKGPNFRPWIALEAGSTAQCFWTLDDDLVIDNTLNPDLDFQVFGEREVRLYVMDDGISAFEQVTMLNLGFDAGEDSGRYGPGATYNYPPQPVVEIENLLALSGLEMFMAAHSTLAVVPFTGMSNLVHIECFHAEIKQVDLTGCDSLIRLCLESCRLTTLDLNPVSDTLMDLRAAVQRYNGGSFTLASITATMAVLYHYCVRNNVLVNTIPHAKMPVVEQRWDWETNTSTIDAPVSPLLIDYQSFGNPYNQATVDSILTTLVTLNSSSTAFAKTLRLEGGDQTPAAPSSTGLAAKSTLQSRGWTVNTL